MTVSAAEVLKGFFNTQQALGTKSVSSDAYLEIEGHEDMGFLTKQFPWPTLGVTDVIEVPGPQGSNSAMPQQVKTYQQGPVTFSETVAGRVMRFMEEVVARGGKFHATVYEGVPDAFYRAYRIRNCIFVPDTPDRDWENRSQLMLFSGTLHFHYFGDKLPGNIAAT